MNRLEAARLRVSLNLVGSALSMAAIVIFAIYHQPIAEWFAENLPKGWNKLSTLLFS